MIPVLDSAQMRRADRAAIRGGIPSEVLMENAAAAVERDVREAFPRAERIVVVCGPGNNGGDGLAAARRLASARLSVSVFTLRDPGLYRGDAATNALRATRVGLELVPLTTAGGVRSLRRWLADADVVLDALFGTGLTRALHGDAAAVVAAIEAAARPVVAADLPSGLSADRGSLIGPCVTATRTVAFAAPKRCHVLAPARSRCGRVTVADIGIPRAMIESQKSRLRMSEAADVVRLLPPRPADSHKGDYGRLAVVAGSRGKAGAAVLCARGALRTGAGLVTVFCPASIEPTVVTALPESMTWPLPEKRGALGADAAAPLREALSDFDAAVVGPGLTVSKGTRAVLEALLQSKLPLVCDADALNAFGGQPGAFSRRAATILTPHPGEAARLVRATTASVQADRLSFAIRLARSSRAVALLKGDGSLTATPRGRVTVNPTGTPLLAVAGSGDVLAGAIGALLAGGMDPEDAAIVGAYLHGAAAQRLERALGDAGLLTSDLADAIPRARAAMIRRSRNGEQEAGNVWNPRS